MPSVATIERRALQLGLTTIAVLAGLGMTAVKLMEAYVVMRRWDRERAR